METISELSKFVYDTRIRDKLSQNQFAKKLGLTYVTVSKIENGHNAGSKALRALSKYTGVKVSELKKLGGE